MCHAYLEPSSFNGFYLRVVLPLFGRFSTAASIVANRIYVRTTSPSSCLAAKSSRLSPVFGTPTTPKLSFSHRTMGPAPLSGDLCRRPQFFNYVFSRLLILALLLIGNTHPHPGPSSTTSSRRPQQTPQLPPLGIISWNCNGIRNSCAELNNFLDSRQVKIACIQETKLSASTKTPSFPGYVVIPRDRPVGGGGVLITLVHPPI